MKEVNDLNALLAKLVHPTSDVDLSFLNLLGADTTLRALLVHTLDPEFDDIHLKSAFLPYGERPLVAIKGPNAVVVLQDCTNAHEALKDSDGWFKSQGMHLRAVSAKLLDTAHSVVLKVSDSAQDDSPGHYWERADRKIEHAVQSLLADTKSITTSSENLIALQEEAHEGMEAIKDVEVAENDNLLPVMKHGSCSRVTLGPHLPEIQLTTVPARRDRTKNFRELKKPAGQQEAQDVTSQLELFNELKSTLSSQSLSVKKWLIKELLAGMPHDAVKEIMESARRNPEVSDIESQTMPERKHMFWTMIFSLSATIACHVALFLLSWKFEAKEGKCTSGEETATWRK